MYRVRTDLGTHSGLHQVHYRLTQYQAIFINGHPSPSASVISIGSVSSKSSLMSAHRYQHG